MPTHEIELQSGCYFFQTLRMAINKKIAMSIYAGIKEDFSTLFMRFLTAQTATGLSPGKKPLLSTQTPPRGVLNIAPRGL